MTSSQRSVRRDLLWGVRFGLLLAAVLVAWVTLVFLVNGSRPFVTQGVSWASVSAGYLISGFVCGTVLGTIRPHLTSAFRSMLLGPFVAFPFLVILGSIIDSPFWTWDLVFWTIWIVVSAILGSLLGGIYWFMFRRFF